MNTVRRWQCGCLAGLGLALATITGCQTNVAGMTLPTGHYLQHPPQYISPSPPFPLTRELASQEAQGAAANGAALPAVGALPPPVVPPGPAAAAPAPANAGVAGQ
jgi:hypothetical protein